MCHAELLVRVTDRSDSENLSGTMVLDDTERDAVGRQETGIGEKDWEQGIFGGRKKEAVCTKLGCSCVAADFGSVSGDAFDGGEFRCDVFAGDFGVIVGLHVDPEHFAQP
jgi:hypothetical protein